MCILLTLFGLMLALTSPWLLDSLIKSQMILSPNSANFPMWKDLPAPIKTSVYLFNVTNYQDFSATGAIPILREVGPYVFWENHHKSNLVWNEDNGTVTYNQTRTYSWSPEHSLNHSLDDVIVLLNVPAATVGQMALKESSFVRRLMDLGLKMIKEELFVRKTVREILFEGYSDPLLNVSQFVHEHFHVPMPGITDRFGFFYQRNNSDARDGVFNMFTGAGNISRLGLIAEWNYSNRTSFFLGNCSRVQGAGDFFPPHVPDATVQLFSNDLCRPIRMQFDNKTSFKGVPGNRYMVDKLFFANRLDNPDNWCFDMGPQPLKSGVFNVSSCQFGAPIFMSQPHFYQADSSYLCAIAPGSLHPDQSRHETAFVIEPQSGVPIQVAARFQVNVLVDRIDELSLFSKVPTRTFFPVIWFESRYDLPDALAGQMWLLSHLTSMANVVGLLLMSLGVAVALITLAFWWVLRIPASSTLAPDAEAILDENDDQEDSSSCS